MSTADFHMYAPFRPNGSPPSGEDRIILERLCRRAVRPIASESDYWGRKGDRASIGSMADVILELLAENAALSAALAHSGDANDAAHATAPSEPAKAHIPGAGETISG
jgi:hypothetical protein